MPQPTVLISRAGIAGAPRLLWLANSGYRTTIVELADGIRPGGQTVDLRGAGGDVVERMGLMDQIAALTRSARCCVGVNTTFCHSASPKAPRSTRAT
ncbi:MAG: hypothetical protein NVSMB60_18450 [Mycobacterium sp.]